MADYLSSSDVTNAGAGGRLGTVWGSLSTPAQNDYIASATARVDQTTGQAGGPGALFAASGRTYTLRPSTGTDTLFLPNKPVTAVTAISVVDPARNGTTNLICTDGVSVLRTGGRSFQFIPEAVNQWFWDQPFPARSIITVTYTAGYATIPQAVKRAAVLFLAADLFDLLDNPGGASEVKDQGLIHIYGRTMLANHVLVQADRWLESHKLGFIPLTAL